MKITIDGHRVDFDSVGRRLSIDGGEYQSVPGYWDTLDYRYSHGGAVYRKACEAYWEKYDEWERLKATIVSHLSDIEERG